MLQRKAIDCLAIGMFGPTDPRRRLVLHDLVGTYSAKAVERKLEELARKGYWMYERNVYTGSLTELGRAVIVIATGRAPQC